jgi:hypothetical protein
MMSYADERETMDQALDEQERWWGLEVTGWTILVFVAIPVLFVFTGWRAGSWFWFWATAILGLIGLVLTGTAALMRIRAAERFKTLGEAARSRVEARSETSEPPRDIDPGRRAA